MKNLLLILILLSVIIGNTGCALLLAGAAGGAGTAVWLSDKLIQEVDSSFEQSIKAVKKSLQQLNLELVKETKKDDVAQMISEYYDGKKIWVDVHQMTPKVSRIEVRVGLTGDETAARKVLDQILKNL